MEQVKVDLIETMIRDVEGWIKTADAFLIENGIITEDKKFTTIMNAILHFRTINPNMRYISLIKNRDGFVIDYVRTNDIINEQELPVDFVRGFYSITHDGEIYKDELQKMKLMED